MTYSIAAIAVETGIAPSELLKADNRMLDAIIMVLKDRAKAVKRGRKG